MPTNDEPLDPADVMAVDATPDEVRLHEGGDETDGAERSDGARVHVDEDGSPKEAH